MITKIILGIIVLHLIAGFGWMVYKLSGQSGEDLIDSSEEVVNKTKK